MLRNLKSIITIIGLESLIGCSSNISMQYPNHYANFSAPITLEHSKELRKNEFLIPDTIFDSYAQTVDKRPWWLISPIGGCININYLNTLDEKKEFKKRLNEKGLTYSEIKYYEKLLSTPKIIIFKKSILKKPERFKEALTHERFHLEIKKISSKKYNLMMQSAEEFYAYLAQDEFVPQVEQALKKDYPEQYKFFKTIKNKVDNEKLSNVKKRVY